MTNFTEIRELLNFTSEFDYEKKPAKYHVSGLKNVKKGIQKASSIKYLKKEIEIIDSLITHSSTILDEVEMDSSIHSKFKDSIHNLKIKLDVIEQVEIDRSYKSNQNLLKITIPEMSSFDELSKISNDLKKAIEIPILHNDIDGQVNIVAGGEGSLLIYITVGTTIAMKLIGSIAIAAMEAKKKHSEAKIFDQHATTLQLKNEMLESIRNAQKSQIEEFTKLNANKIHEEYYNEKSNEITERLKLSINLFNSLFDRGIQILPQSSDEEITQLFPDYTPLLLDKITKNIEEK